MGFTLICVLMFMCGYCFAYWQEYRYIQRKLRLPKERG